MADLPHLTSSEARVLGCLLEKQMTTPEYYPLTLNALVAACNQKSNRHPVVTYDEETVQAALEGLDARSLAGITRSSGGRAVKFVHRAGEALGVDTEQLALLAVMLLRGPQTPGELRTRTDRYVSFPSVDAVDERLADLMTRDEPLVERLSRAPGQKEHRYRTLIAPDDGPATGRPPALDPIGRRMADLEARVSALEHALGVGPEDL